MKPTIQFLLSAILLFATPNSNATLVEKSEYTQYSNAEYLFLNMDLEIPASPSNFCQYLISHKPNENKISCREAGSLQRNHSMQNYLKWLQKNLILPTNAKLLKSRLPTVDSLLHSIRDEYLLVTLIGQNQKRWVLLFHDAKNFPVAIVYYPKNQKKDKFLQSLYHDLFSQKSTAIPSEEQRKILKETPAEYYRDQLSLDWFLGAGMGYNSGRIPGIPRDWYSANFEGKVQHYNQVQGDSLSTWSWIQEGSPTQSLRFGLRFAQFLGLSSIFRLSSYPVKTIPKDSLYRGLNAWNFKRLEVGLAPDIGFAWQPYSFLELYPHLIIGLHYSFYFEEFNLEKDSPGTLSSINRFSFPVLKGATLGTGLLILLYKQVGIQFETGMSTRGASKDVDVLGQQETPPQVIGGQTSDFYLEFSIIYNHRLWLN